MLFAVLAVNNGTQPCCVTAQKYYEYYIFYNSMLQMSKYTIVTIMKDEYTYIIYIFNINKT